MRSKNDEDSGLRKLPSPDSKFPAKQSKRPPATEKHPAKADAKDKPTADKAQNTRDVFANAYRKAAKKQGLR